jgi:hypothetical protein
MASTVLPEFLVSDNTNKRLHRLSGRRLFPASTSGHKFLRVLHRGTLRSKCNGFELRYNEAAEFHHAFFLLLKDILSSVYFHYLSYVSLQAKTANLGYSGCKHIPQSLHAICIRSHLQANPHHTSLFNNTIAHRIS